MQAFHFLWQPHFLSIRCAALWAQHTVPQQILESNAEQSVTRLGGKWTPSKKQEMLSPLIREPFNIFPFSLLPLLNRLSRGQSCLLSNLVERFQVPICLSSNPAMFLVTS